MASPLCSYIMCSNWIAVMFSWQVCALLWSSEYKELVSSHGFAQNQLVIWKYPSLTKVAELTGETETPGLWLLPTTSPMRMLAPMLALEVWSSLHADFFPPPLCSCRSHITSVTHGNVTRWHHCSVSCSRRDSAAVEVLWRGHAEEEKPESDHKTQQFIADWTGQIVSSQGTHLEWPTQRYTSHLITRHLQWTWGRPAKLEARVGARTHWFL